MVGLDLKRTVNWQKYPAIKTQNRAITEPILLMLYIIAKNGGKEQNILTYALISGNICKLAKCE